MSSMSTLNPTTIKCLAVRRPYASWLCTPEKFAQVGIEPKKEENRTWRPARVGFDFLILSSKTFEDDAFEYWSAVFPDLERAVSMDPDDYPRGMIIGKARLDRVVQSSKSKWFLGPYGFVLSDVHLLDTPIPYRGQLNFFEVPRSVLRPAQTE